MRKGRSVGEGKKGKWKNVGGAEKKVDGGREDIGEEVKGSPKNEEVKLALFYLVLK